VVQDAKEFSDHGINYEAGKLNWDESILVTISDASWSGEKEIVRGSVEPWRSQRARMTALADKSFLEGMESPIYPIEESL